MKNYLPILMAVLFCACDRNDLLSYYQSDTVPKVSFKYTIDEHTVKFINTSHSNYRNMDFRWEFGDGQYYDGYNAEHYYTKNGKYNVVLKAYENSKLQAMDEEEITINVCTPATRYFEKAYIKGYRFYKLPYKSAYYNITCVTNDTEGGEKVWRTGAMQINRSDLPYSYIWATHKYLDAANYTNSFSAYNFIALIVTYSASENGSYTKLLEHQIKGEDMGNKGETLDEYIFTSDNGKTKVGLLIEYE